MYHAGGGETTGEIPGRIRLKKLEKVGILAERIQKAVGMLDESRILPLNLFLNTMREGCQNEKRYCFILGAGASKTSGIPTGEELAKQWHEEILERYTQQEIQQLKKRLGVRKTQPSSKAYFDLYALRFFPDYHNGSAFLERAMEQAQPSLGYYPLAALLASTENNLVITTNFDSLVEDALFIYTEKKPIVISHELLAQYINFNTRRPIVAKIHRGLFFDPLNRAEQVNGLSEQWKEILREAFKRYTPVVIGYAGGDHSLMDFLKNTDRLNGLYWCYRHEEPPAEIQRVVERHGGFFVPIEGFDEMMYLMGQKFGCEDPCERIKRVAEQRVSHYQEQVGAFQAQLRAMTDPSEDQSRILRALDENQQAKLQRLNRSLELDGEDGQTYRERGMLFCQANEYQLAYRDLTRAAQLGAEDSQLYLQRGNCCYYLGQIEEAIQDYNRSLELEENSLAYRNRGLMYMQKQEYGAAVADFTQAIALTPDQQILYTLRARAYCNNWEYEKSRADSEQALELGMPSAEIHTVLADALEELGQDEQALQNYQKALQLDPDYERAYNNRGVFYLNRGQQEAALADFRKAVRLKPDEALYHANVGSALNELKRWKEALTSCNRAIKLNPQLAVAYQIRANTYEGMGQPEKAAQDRQTYETLTGEAPE